VLVAARSAAGAPESARLDGVAAVIDSEVILLSEVHEAADPVLIQIEHQQGAIPPDARRKILADALQSLIDERLILDVAKRMQMEATPEEIDGMIAKIAEEEHLSVDEVYAATARQGLPRDKYREQMGAQIARMKVVSAAVRSRIAVTDEEVRALFQERFGQASAGLHVRVRHILVPWPPDGSPESAERLRGEFAKLREAVAGGADFGSIARDVSRAPSAANGGLSVLKQGEVAPEIEAVVFTLQPGELSPIVETPHGVNLFLVLERFDPSQLKLEDMAPRLRAEIADKKTRPELERWLQDLRKNRYIHVVAPELQPQ
jgi:peptidyl-prolyl cis-trans isomerase SurA